MKKIISSIPLFVLMLMSSSLLHAQEERLGNFEIQRLTSMYNQAETLSSSLKGLISQQIPSEIAGVPAKASAWNQQTTILQGLRSKVDSTLEVIGRALKDKQVTKTEWAQSQAKAKESCDSYKANTGTYANADAILKRRYESLSLWYQALCTNEN